MLLLNYRTLGRSGIAVRPLALGTITFGSALWGSGEEDSQAIFNAYVDACGNLVYTADVYSAGKGEEMLGSLFAEQSLRDSIVLATKLGLRPREDRTWAVMGPSIFTPRLQVL